MWPLDMSVPRKEVWPMGLSVLAKEVWPSLSKEYRLRHVIYREGGVDSVSVSSREVGVASIPASHGKVGKEAWLLYPSVACKCLRPTHWRMEV